MKDGPYILTSFTSQIRETELMVQREIAEKRQELLAKEESLRCVFLVRISSWKVVLIAVGEQEPGNSPYCSRIACGPPRLIGIFWTESFFEGLTFLLLICAYLLDESTGRRLRPHASSLSTSFLVIKQSDLLIFTA